MGIIAFTLALLGALPSAQPVQLIVIDNRSERCNADSRIAEGNRRRAEIKAQRLAKELRDSGETVKIVRLEAGETFAALEYGNPAVLLKAC